MAGSTREAMMPEIDDLRRELSEVRIKLESHLATCEERNKHMAEELRELTDTVKRLTTVIGHLKDIEQQARGGWWIIGLAAMAFLQVATLSMLAIQTFKG